LKERVTDLLLVKGFGHADAIRLPHIPGPLHDGVASDSCHCDDSAAKRPWQACNRGRRRATGSSSKHRMVAVGGSGGLGTAFEMRELPRALRPFARDAALR
jgi:hypothetical protein